MFVAHAHTLAVARSCIAELADTALTCEASTSYEEALAALDLIHGDRVPAINSVLIRDDDTQQLFVSAVGSVTRLREYGIDPLHIDLVLAMLGDAHEMDQS